MVQIALPVAEVVLLEAVVLVETTVALDACIPVWQIFTKRLEVPSQANGVVNV